LHVPHNKAQQNITYTRQTAFLAFETSAR